MFGLGFVLDSGAKYGIFFELCKHLVIYFAFLCNFLVFFFEFRLTFAQTTSNVQVLGTKKPRISQRRASRIYFQENQMPPVPYGAAWLIPDLA